MFFYNGVEINAVEKPVGSVQVAPVYDSTIGTIHKIGQHDVFVDYDFQIFHGASRFADKSM